MKNLLYITLLFLFSSALWAQTERKFLVTDFKNNERRQVLDLKTNLSQTKVQLDCSSFIHGVLIDTYFFYLYESECYEFIEFIVNSKERGKDSCISLYDQSYPRYKLSNDSASCLK